MADELQITLSSRLSNGNLKDVIESNVYKVTQDTIGAHMPVVSVGTSEEDLSVGDVAILGWAYLRNLDATNYVTYGPSAAGSMVAFGRLEPGEFAMLRLSPGITLRWKADTAAVKVLVRLYQD